MITRILANIGPLVIGGILVGLIVYGASWSLATVTNAMLREEQNNLIMRAGTIAIMLDPRNVSALRGDSTDLTNPAYIELKRQLQSVVRFSNDDVRFAYLTGIRGDEIYFIADSEDPVSSGYSAPGQVYYGAKEFDRLMFERGQPYFKNKYTDEYGTFYSGFVPVRVASTTIAMVGIDVLADKVDLRISIVRNTMILVFALIALLVIVLSLIGRNVVIMRLR